jgi:hypothetical protein
MGDDDVQAFENPLHDSQLNNMSVSIQHKYLPQAHVVHHLHKCDEENNGAQLGGGSVACAIVERSTYCVDKKPMLSNGFSVEKEASIKHDV